MIKKLAEEFLEDHHALDEEQAHCSVLEFAEYLDSIGFFMPKKCKKCNKDMQLVYENEYPEFYHCFECYPVPTKEELEKMK